MTALLGAGEVERWLAPGPLRGVLAQALMDLSAGRAAAPPRIAVRAAEGLLAAMPGYVPTEAGAGVLGAKLVTVFPGNAARGLEGHQALIALFDGATGAPLAVLDGTAITAARTGGVSAVATQALARREARVLAILGTGVQAEAHWRAVREVREFAEVRVAGRSRARVAARADAWGAVAAESFEAAVRGADVVCACTHAAEPILRRGWLRAGAHVNSVGIGGCELDRETVTAGLLAVEALTAFAPFPIGAYELQGLERSRGVELGTILAGGHPGRRSEEEITVFKSVGHAVEDVATAAWVWQRARMLG
ncbi:MAG TPA: ornithine cyclodeaminase family protein [Terriglobales bacterium]|nr:ornithine cyclodeaminase family protein [Terriglobales bacterium]